MQGEAFKDALAYYKETSRAFTVERTGYTASIHDEEGKKYLFADTPIRNQLFGIFSKLKAEVKRAGIPEIDERAVKYYSFKQALSLDKLPNLSFCVDMSSAYITALLHLGLITETLFDTLNKLPKKERLKVVGMLAVEKTVITYQGGRITGTETRTSETRPAFFAACMEVGRIMDTAAQHPKHLFYWVDGAFFSEPVPEVETYFRELGYRTKVETVTDLRWSKSKNYLFYTKDGARKYLCVPTQKPSKEWIAQLLNNPNNPTR
jgi:hypothetical protein